MCIHRRWFFLHPWVRLYYGRLALHRQTFWWKKRKWVSLSFLSSLPAVAPQTTLNHFCTSLGCTLQRHMDICLVIPLYHLWVSLFFSSVFLPALSFKLFMLIHIPRQSASAFFLQWLGKRKASWIRVCKYRDEKCGTRLMGTVGKCRQNSANSFSQHFDRKKDTCGWERWKISLWHFLN